VKLNPFSLKFVCINLKNDQEFILETVEINALSFQHASQEIRNQKKIVLRAVRKNRFSFQFASDDLKNDKEIAWISMGYFKMIRSIKTFDLNFKFSKKRIFLEIE
jgi:fatty acid/phospholipid biosynthesis enzyme